APASMSERDRVGLGDADHADLGVGEDGPRNDAMIDALELRSRGRERVPRDDASIVRTDGSCLLVAVLCSDHVAGRPDVLDRRAQKGVDDDVAATVDGDADVLEAEVIRARST